MNTNDHDSHDRDARFDAAMRQLHATAVDRVSGRTRLRLQRFPDAKPAAAPARHHVGWRPLAASFAAVLALMVGVQLWNAPEPEPESAGQAPLPTTSVADAADAGDDIDAVLDENPDLYLWLASNDAYALAME